MIAAVGKAYKPWLIASLTVLVLSLMLLAGAVVGAFLSFGKTATPVWVVALGAVAVLGVGVGFGGFFLLMAAAGWHAFREGRRVQVISPGRNEAGEGAGR